MARRTMRVLRQKTRVNYYEPEEPSLDEYVFCESCADYVFEYCAIHGPLLVIPDDKVSYKPNIPGIVPRAALTIPRVFLHLARSIIPGAGIGVFSTLTLPRGVRFGPYRGLRCYTIESTYCWQIYDRNNKPSHVVDAADAQRSNWMRYVNCARHWTEQNLVAYQYKGQLYYRTIKIIPRFTELLVFYGSEFANNLRVNLGAYNAPRGYASKFGAPVTKKPKLGSLIENTRSTIVTKPVVEETVVQNTDEEKKIETIKRAIVKKITVTDKHIEKKTVERSGGLQSKGKSYRCEVCEKCFSLKSRLITHTRIHTGERPYTCDVCEKGFKQKYELIAHTRIHTGEKPYTCDICKKSFKQKTHLISHTRIHTGKKPYTCDICEKSFQQKNDLTKHTRIHTGEKPYTCDICKKSFKQKTHLISHTRIHTGEKPYTCDICEKSFQQKSGLLRHILIHTGGKPFACNVCKKCFNQKSNLISHTRIHNGEKSLKCAK